MAELTHWKKTMNPDYLGAWAISQGKTLVLTIQKAVKETVIGADGKKEECLVAYFKENVKPNKMVLNVTNCKAISKVAGTPYIEKWSGVRIELYTEKVKAFGEITDALRVKKNAPTGNGTQAAPKSIDEVETEPEQTEPTAAVLTCEGCGGEIKPYRGMSPEELAEYTYNSYGKRLCADCAMKAKG